MIDRLWPDRLALVDLMIDLHPDEPAPFRAVYALERFAIATRAGAKAAFHRVAADARGGAADGRQRRRMERQRLDKWIWFARIVKSRVLAVRLVEAGHVRVNGSRSTVVAKARRDRRRTDDRARS